MDDRSARLRLASRMVAIAPFEVMEIQALARARAVRRPRAMGLRAGDPARAAGEAAQEFPRR